MPINLDIPLVFGCWLHSCWGLTVFFPELPEETGAHDLQSFGGSQNDVKYCFFVAYTSFLAGKISKAFRRVG